MMGEKGDGMLVRLSLEYKPEVPPRGQCTGLFVSLTGFGGRSSSESERCWGDTSRDPEVSNGNGLQYVGIRRSNDAR